MGSRLFFVLLLLSLGDAGSLATARAGDLLISNLLSQAKYDEAIAECTQRIDSGENDVRDRAYHYDCRAYAYCRKGKNDKALADYGRALALEPTPQRYSRRAGLYEELGRHDRAVADYHKAAALYRRHGAEDEAQEAERAAQNVAESRGYTAYFLCAVLGYVLGRCFRKTTDECQDRKSWAASWMVLVASITVFPYLAVRVLNWLGWTSALTYYGWRTIGLVLGLCLVACVVIGVLVYPIWGVHRVWRAWRARRPAAEAGPLARSAPAAVPCGPGQREPFRCPSCGAAVPEGEDVRFCHLCGAALAAEETQREHN